MVYTKDEQMEIAKTIIGQMGGQGKLRAMVGAHDFIVTDSGVQFGFKGSKKANKVVIDLTPMDLYDVKFYKINMRNIDKSLIPVDTTEGAYDDMLIDLFEGATGLSLHL